MVLRSDHCLAFVTTSDDNVACLNAKASCFRHQSTHLANPFFGHLPSLSHDLVPTHPNGSADTFVSNQTPSTVLVECDGERRRQQGCFEGGRIRKEVSTASQSEQEGWVWTKQRHARLEDPE